MSIRREIHTNSASKQLPLLLQGILIGELLYPSKKIWLYSAWLSNIPILDNKANAFRHIEPLWPRGIVTLTAVLEKLLEKGCQIFIMTNEKEHNDQIMLWIDRMRAKGFSNIKGM